MAVYSVTGCEEEYKLSEGRPTRDGENPSRREKMTMMKGGFILFSSIVYMLITMGPRMALCETPHEDLKDRVERLEKKSPEGNIFTSSSYGDFEPKME